MSHDTNTTPTGRPSKHSKPEHILYAGIAVSALSMTPFFPAILDGANKLLHPKTPQANPITPRAPRAIILDEKTSARLKEIGKVDQETESQIQELLQSIDEAKTTRDYLINYFYPIYPQMQTSYDQQMMDLSKNTGNAFYLLENLETTQAKNQEYKRAILILNEIINQMGTQDDKGNQITPVTIKNNRGAEINQDLLLEVKNAIKDGKENAANYYRETHPHLMNHQGGIIVNEGQGKVVDPNKSVFKQFGQ